MITIPHTYWILILLFLFLFLFGITKITFLYLSLRRLQYIFMVTSSTKYWNYIKESHLIKLITEFRGENGRKKQGKRKRKGTKYLNNNFQYMIKQQHGEDVPLHPYSIPNMNPFHSQKLFPHIKVSLGLEAQRAKR